MCGARRKRNKNDIAASLNKCATVPSEWSQTEEVICVGVLLYVCAMLQYDAGTLGYPWNTEALFSYSVIFQLEPSV